MNETDDFRFEFINSRALSNGFRSVILQTMFCEMEDDQRKLYEELLDSGRKQCGKLMKSFEQDFSNNENGEKY